MFIEKKLKNITNVSQLLYKNFSKCLSTWITDHTLIYFSSLSIPYIERYYKLMYETFSMMPSLTLDEGRSPV